MESENGDVKRILVQFKNELGEATGSPFDIPVDVDPKKLELICNAITNQEEKIPYSFFIGDSEITSTLEKTIFELKDDIESNEHVLDIIYQPLAIFKVRSVTRCTSSIEGHSDAVISVAFSPNGQYLASGSGDTTVRFWDLTTESPAFTCKGHSNWILCISWSPDGRKLASACKDGQIKIWNPITGKQISRTLSGHKQWITSLSWKPLHLDGACRFICSSSKDATVKIWDIVLGQCKSTISGHSSGITCVIWGGSDLIYTCSQDRTVKVWRSDDGVLCRTLQGHGHWVNMMTTNTAYVMRTGSFEPAEAKIVPDPINEKAEEQQSISLARYQKFLTSSISKEPSCFGELLASCSDDFTIILWNPEKEKKPVARMTGHQQPVNDIRFSPDGRFIASASFDKSVKLWNGKSGKFICSLRGHVQRVYQVAWSADSRLLCSSSADSTLKVWNVSSKKLHGDLPGHADEVYAVDWSPDGQRVASGGKDKVLKIWRS